jgi:hypothetical protein
MGVTTQRNYQIPATGNAKVWHQFTSTTSDRVGKKLKLTQHPCLLRHNVEVRRIDIREPDLAGISLPGAGSYTPDNSWVDWTGLEQRALAKFNGKLRKGSASLGVTMATWSQSSQMIQKRLLQALNMFDKRERELLYMKKRGKVKYYHGPDVLANNILEYEFGWVPLFQDIHAAMFTVCQDGIPPSYVVGRHKETLNKTTRQQIDSQRWKTDAYLGKCWKTCAARVEISNPNLWLLNRMGLINPLGPLWDIIPWSFLVGAFVNVNAMINSLTNEVGLTISDRSVTAGAVVLRSVGSYRDLGSSASDPRYRGIHGQESQVLVKYRDRTVGTLPTVKWQVRVPDVSFETLLILGSLVVQKAGRISSLVLRN